MTPDRIAEVRRLVALLAQTTNPYLVEAVGELLDTVEAQTDRIAELEARTPLVGSISAEKIVTVPSNFNGSINMDDL